MFRRFRETTRSSHLLAILLLVATAVAAGAQPAPAGRAARNVRKDTTAGFVIQDQTVIARCGSCHTRDSTGLMERLSYMRKTPEGWEASLRRMVTLNNVKVDPASAREIVKYFSNQQGLAPEEARPGRFEVERRLIEYRYTADTRTEQTCRACHSLGRVVTQRRTRDEWDLLMATHRGYYPLVDFQAFRRGGPPPPDSAPPPHPMDVAVAHLSRVFPLRTPEWAAWSATMRPPRIEGTWLLAGREPGRGPFYGRLTITKGASDDEFTTKATYRYTQDGRTATREGRSLVYTGHQWRGRSSEIETPPDSAWREVMSIEPGWREINGRWFRGGYDEIGMDVSLTRLGNDPVVAGAWPRGLRWGSRDVAVTIAGANFPASIPASAIDFGPGVRVSRVERSTPDEIVVRVNVDSGAVIGARDLFVSGAMLRGAAVVFDKIARIKVTPQAGMARVGGVAFPKQHQQFEVMAVHNGADAKPDTDDDLDLGPVDVAWSIEEYGATFDDDDMKWVGKIDARGFFIPNIDGPNPQRAGNRNNIGDVWVVASYAGDGKTARPMKARAHLVVTVPLYMRWEPWRAEQ